jgi:ABC-type uncharacterized transport system involved in gliding motility auxiliary subunit
MKLTSPNRTALRKTALKKYAKYLFWLAPVLIVMGLTAGAIAGWTALPIGLIVAGVAVLLLWLVSADDSQPSFWNRRSTQVGTNALIASLAVLAILGCINFLAARYNTRVDLTENQIFTLAPQSQEVLHNLKEPVKAWIFTPNPNATDRQLLDNYRRETSSFSYEYVDPQAKPGVAREFGVQSIGEMYLEAGGKRRLVQTLTPAEPLSERKLTNGLAQVANSAPQKVYFLQGHGERSLDAGQGAFSQAKGRLGEESLTPAPLNLAENPKIPDDASAVVVAGPQRPLLNAEINALKDYQKRKSGLMVMLDPQTNPKLDGLLKDWGVTVSDRLVTDPAGQSSGLGAEVVIVNQYSDHPITKGFKSGISFYPLVRPLQIMPVDGVQAVPLLVTAERTKAQQIAKSGEVQTNSTDPKGPFDIGAALSRTITASPTPSPNSSNNPPNSAVKPGAAASPSPSPDNASKDNVNKPEARLVVIGSSSFATDGLFDQQLNGDVFLNSVKWLSQQDDQVLSIRSKEVTNRRILMSPAQQTSSVLLALLLLPLAAFSTAALIWWRRR